MCVFLVLSSIIASGCILISQSARESRIRVRVGNTCSHKTKLSVANFLYSITTFRVL